MDLDAKPLRYFIAVAEEKSFSRAATKMNVSQPSLSAQIRELERRLGFALFNRTSRRVELSREGDLFLTEAARMVAAARWMNRAARDIAANQLRIGAPLFTLNVPERVSLIEDFVAAFPQAAVQVSTAGPRRQFVDLRRGACDVAVVIGQVPENSARRFLADRSQLDEEFALNFETLTLAEKPMALTVPVEHPLAALDPIPVARLAGHQVAVLDRRNGGSLIDSIAPALIAAGADRVTPPEANAIAVERYGRLLRLPALALGWFQDTLPSSHGDMVRRPIAGLNVVTRLGLVRRQGAQRPLADAFWSFAAARPARSAEIAE